MFSFSLQTLIFVIGLSITSVLGRPATIDTSYYYRLTNAYTGSKKSLDVLPDGSGNLQIADTGNYAGQYWRFVQVATGPKYALRTEYLGDGFSLDIVNDNGRDSRLTRLVPTGYFTGQYWTVTPWGDGTYGLSNDFTGASKFLDVFSDTLVPNVDFADHTGQHWTLTKVKLVTENKSIPPLKPGANQKSLNEGETDYSRSIKPEGTIKVAVLFVEFDDAPHTYETEAQVLGDVIRGHGKLEQLFATQSYGKVNVIIEPRVDLGWHKLPSSLKRPFFSTYEETVNYFTAAAKTFSPTEINLSSYDVIVLKTPQGGGVTRSSMNGPLSIQSPCGAIRYAVILGDDSNNVDTGYRTLVHELGHCFGLPDLYLYKGTADFWPMGAWDTMSTSYLSHGYSGWHRHKMGWLAERRKRYITPISGIAAKLTLTPLESEDGVSMVVAALGFGEQSKVLVFQVVEPVAVGYEGVLVYTVDSTIESGQGAMKVIPKEEGYDYRYGNGYKAPFGVGDRMEYHVSGKGIVELFVEQRFGNSYHIEISYKGLF